MQLGSFGDRGDFGAFATDGLHHAVTGGDDDTKEEGIDQGFDQERDCAEAGGEQAEEKAANRDDDADEEGLHRVEADEVGEAIAAHNAEEDPEENQQATEGDGFVDLDDGNEGNKEVLQGGQVAKNKGGKIEAFDEGDEVKGGSAETL